MENQGTEDGAYRCAGSPLKPAFVAASVPLACGRTAADCRLLYLESALWQRPRYANAGTFPTMAAAPDLDFRPAHPTRQEMPAFDYTVTRNTMSCPTMLLLGSLLHTYSPRPLLPK